MAPGAVAAIMSRRGKDGGTEAAPGTPTEAPVSPQVETPPVTPSEAVEAEEAPVTPDEAPVDPAQTASQVRVDNDIDRDADEGGVEEDIEKVVSSPDEATLRRRLAEFFNLYPDTQSKVALQLKELWEARQATPKVQPQAPASSTGILGGEAEIAAAEAEMTQDEAESIAREAGIDVEAIRAEGKPQKSEPTGRLNADDVSGLTDEQRAVIADVDDPGVSPEYNGDKAAGVMIDGKEVVFSEATDFVLNQVKDNAETRLKSLRKRTDADVSTKKLVIAKILDNLYNLRSAKAELQKRKGGGEAVAAEKPKPLGAKPVSEKEVAAEKAKPKKPKPLGKPKVKPAAKPSTPQVAAKEPWEMTRGEWAKEQGKLVSGQSVSKTVKLAKALHKDHVKI